MNKFNKLYKLNSVAGQGTMQSDWWVPCFHAGRTASIF